MDEEIYLPGETLFNPSDTALQGVHDMLIKTINQCDKDIHSKIKHNIVLCGGTTMMPGFVERLKQELATKEIDVCVKAPENRHYLQLIGASKLALSTHMNGLWITKEEYQQMGPAIIHRKCI